MNLHLVFRPPHTNFWLNCLPNEKAIEKTQKVTSGSKKLVSVKHCFRQQTDNEMTNAIYKANSPAINDTTRQDKQLNQITQTIYPQNNKKSIQPLAIN